MEQTNGSETLQAFLEAAKAKGPRTTTWPAFCAMGAGRPKIFIPLSGATTRA